MNEGDLLARIAATLKREVGPAVNGEYPKTQAFMASVVLQKLARQLSLLEQHRQAFAADHAALLSDLAAFGDAQALPAAVTDAITTLRDKADKAALSTLLETLYANHEVLGDDRFEAILSRVRRTLRAQLTRELEYAE